MQREKNEYLIFLFSNDVSKFNNFFAYVLQNSTIAERMPDFKAIFNPKKIEIKLQADRESLDFIELIIKEIDCKIVLASNENALRFQECNIGINDLGEENTVTFEELKSFVTNDPKYKKSNKMRMVIKYMLTLKCFSTKDLKNHFPNMTNKDLYNSIYIAKTEGIISTLTRGVYTVN